MGIIKKLKEWKIKRMVYHSGFSSYESYIKYTDSDIHLSSTTIDGFYHGYRFIIVPNHSCPYDPIFEWCEVNCKDKWRHDWHKVDDSFNIDDFFGGDLKFFAFKSYTDYIWFKLTWNIKYEFIN